MARKPLKLKKAAEEMTPEERAKVFSEGTFTATETGAKASALNPYRRRKNMMKGLSSGMEEIISGKKKL